MKSCLMMSPQPPGGGSRPLSWMQANAKMESHIHRSFNLFVLSWTGPLVPFSCLSLSLSLWKGEKERNHSCLEMNNPHLPARISFLMHLWGGFVGLQRFQDLVCVFWGASGSGGSHKNSFYCLCLTFWIIWSQEGSCVTESNLEVKYLQT